VKCIDDEIPFEIPQGWEWCRMGGLIYPPKYGTSKKSAPSGMLPVLRMGNIQDGEIVFDKLVFSNDLDDNKKLLLQYGDLLFNRTNSSELVGKTAIFRGQRNAIFAGYLILLRPIFINSEYLNLLLNTPYARDYCNDVKTIGVQQCNINAEKISNLLVPIPNLYETVRIVEKIKNIALPIIKYGELYKKLKHLNGELPIILRKSILQEAIQGKLVPQIASEGTAESLLEEIRAEKERLIKEKKIKRDKLDSVIFKGDDNKYYEKVDGNTMCIDDELPFYIPNSWSWSRLGNITQLKIGKTPPRGDSRYWSNGAKPWVSISDMSKGQHITYTKEFISDAAAKDLFLNRISPRGSLLMSFKLSIGKVAILDIDAYHNEAIVTITPYFDNSYIFRDYLMLTLPFLSQLGESKDAIKGKTLNSKSLSNLPIPIPPLSEQLRILAKEKELTKLMKQ
jgi:type I restriction enzyme S subunit